MSWIIFVASVLIAPALGFLRVPQNTYWFLFPRTPIGEHLGCYFALASIPPGLGVLTATVGLGFRRKWIPFATSCIFNLLWLALAIIMTGD
jgi:hypothetical protein